MFVIAIIQTIAAVIQACAAILFFKTVRDSAKYKEQERRDNYIAGLQRLWGQSNFPNVSMTDEELSGFPSERQIEFFNSELRKRGEKWSFPFKRI
jgi:hypothetical protein